MNAIPKITAEKPLAISYARFSTAEQADGDSLNRQTKLAKDYCLKKGLHLIEDRNYFDRGVSAFTGKNKREGKLGDLLEDAEAGVFPPGTTLIVESMDRLGRDNVFSQFQFFARLLTAGLKIVTFDGGTPREYSVQSGSDMITVLMVVTTMSRANEESRMKGERVRAAWATKRQNASQTPLTKIAPYWLKLEGEKFVIIPERAEIVRLIFDLSRKGLGRRSIAAGLNESKVPVWSSVARNPLGLWRDSYIEKILGNPAVIGHYQPHRKEDGKRIPDGDVITNYFPPVLSEAEFFAVSHKMKKRRGKGGRGVDQANNLFSGITSCYCCGGPMHYTHKGENWKYLNCEKKSLKQAPCAARPISYHVVERAVLKHLRSIKWSIVLEEQSKVVEFDEASALKGELAAVEKKLNNLLDVAAEGVFESSVFRAKYEELESRRVALLGRVKLDSAGREERRLDKELSMEASRDMATRFDERLSPDQRLTLKSSILHLVRRVILKRDDQDNTLIVVKLSSGGSLLMKIAGKSGQEIFSERVVECSESLSQIQLHKVEEVFGSSEVENFALIRKIFAA